MSESRTTALTAEQRHGLRLLIDQTRRHRNGLPPRSRPAGVRLDLVNAIENALRERGPMTTIEIHEQIGSPDRPLKLALRYAHTTGRIRVASRSQREWLWRVAR